MGGRVAGEGQEEAGGLVPRDIREGVAGWTEQWQEYSPVCQSSGLARDYSRWVELFLFVFFFESSSMLCLNCQM